MEYQEQEEFKVCLDIKNYLSERKINYKVLPFCPINRIHAPSVDIRNRTNMSNEQKTLKESLKLLGWMSALIAYLNNGNVEIIDGYTRLLFAKELGFTTAPIFLITSKISEEDKVKINIMANSSQTKPTDKEIYDKVTKSNISFESMKQLFLGAKIKGETKINDLKYIIDELTEEEVNKTKDDKDDSFKMTEQVAKILHDTSNKDKEEVKKTIFTIVEDLKHSKKKRDIIRTYARNYKTIQEETPKELELSDKEKLDIAITCGNKSHKQTIISVGSEGRFPLFKDFIKEENFDIAYVYNVGLPIRTSLEENISIEMEGEIVVKYCKSYVLIDKDKVHSDYWLNHRNIKVYNYAAETYLRKELPLEHTLNKTLMHFNLSGDTNARMLLEPRIWKSLLKYIPNLTLSMIFEEEFNTPTSESLNDLEIIRFFGISQEERTNPILTIEQFLKMLEKELPMKFTIKWEKFSTRRVAWIVGNKET